MSTSDFVEYADRLNRLLQSLLGTGLTRLADLKIEPRAARIGLIAGILAFEDESELHFREYVDLSQTESRTMYAYHYQDAEGALIFRYDNAVHRPALSQPEHKHTPMGIMLCRAPTLAGILDEIEDLLARRR